MHQSVVQAILHHANRGMADMCFMLPDPLCSQTIIWHLL